MGKRATRQCLVEEDREEGVDRQKAKRRTRGEEKLRLECSLRESR